MELKSWDAVIVSAFGRGDWLAVELNSQGLKVLLLDMTSRLGVWPAEDVEGPFGFFMHEKYNQSYLEHVAQLDTFESVRNGFAVWTNEGPLEMKSPITSYRMTQLGFHPQLADILLGRVPSKGASLQKEEFSSVWPLALACQLASSTYSPSHAGLQSKDQPLPLMNSFSVCASTRGGFERSLQWVNSKGVDVLSKSDIIDVGLAGRRELTGVELKGEISGFFRLSELVWCLSSEDTYYLSEKIGKKLFPQGILESTWSWMRFRMSVKTCLELTSLPLHVCLIPDVMAPWSHENFCLLQKTVLPEQIDAWIRMPTVQRFNKEYLTEMGSRVVKLISGKLPMTVPEVHTYPQEYYYTYKELGAPRFPVFSKEDDSSRRYVFFRNLHRDGIEVWPHFTRDSRYQVQSHLRDQLVHRWKVAQLKKNQKEQKL